MIDMEGEIIVEIANSEKAFADGRRLFEEYAASLNFNLCFQGFEAELDQISLQYHAPTGALIVAYLHQEAVAVVGIREFEAQKAELKRMYTQPAFRGKKIGNKILEKAIESATELGYKELLLDTLPEMQSAIKLYHQFGFKEIEAYRYNPFDTAIYMAKDLTAFIKI